MLNNLVDLIFVSFSSSKNECNRRHPPGRKIYEDPNGLIIYEVDGTASQVDFLVETNKKTNLMFGIFFSFTVNVCVY